MPSMPSRAAILGNCARELRAHLAQVLQLLVVIAQQARVHRFARYAPEIRDLDLAGFQIDLGAQQQLERHRLGPQIAADLDLRSLCWSSADLAQPPDPERGRIDARLEVDDRPGGCAARAPATSSVEAVSPASAGRP